MDRNRSSLCCWGCSESHSLRTEATSAVNSGYFSLFSILWALSRHLTSPLSLMLCGWMDHPLQSLPVLGRAPTRQHVSPQNLITGNQDSVEETVVQLVLSSLFLCPHFQLLAALVLETQTGTISTLHIYQPCLIPLVKYRWKILTLSLQAPVAAGLHCLARLGDSSFQPSITCKTRKKSSGSFTSLVHFLCLFVEVFLWICGVL